MTLAFVFAGVGTSDEPGPRDEHSQIFDSSSPLQSAGDAELAARIRDGEHEAFTTVFLAHYDALCRFAETYTRDPAEAEEIVEGVLARIWEYHPTFNPSSGIGPYLYAAVRNRALNALRDLQTRRKLADPYAADAEDNNSPGMSASPASMLAALEREELGVVLRRVIDTLPEHRRAVVTMRWFGGLSHAEIASALGTSVNAVEIQLRRALKDLAAGVPRYLKE
jgi:RNA polymerase sigma-70 factor (ECF subfamily)